MPKARLFVDRELHAAFIDPAYLDVLERVAKRHFGMGLFWDESAVSGLPGWDRVDEWWAPPTEKKAPPPPEEPPRPKEPRPPRRKRGELARALQTLGIKEGSTLAEARKVYRKGCLERHPDRGGTTDRMAEWNAAWEVARGTFA